MKPNPFSLNGIGVLLIVLCTAGCTHRKYENLKADFQDLPLKKRLTMPLFWQHGESDTVLTGYVDRIIESGGGSFVIESRPHPDWLGPEWFADCKVILDYAKTRGVKGWIFDEKWWPSFVVNGMVPAEYRAKKLQCEAVEHAGPVIVESGGHGGGNRLVYRSGYQTPLFAFGRGEYQRILLRRTAMDGQLGYWHGK